MFRFLSLLLLLPATLFADALKYDFGSGTVYEDFTQVTTASGMLGSTAGSRVNFNRVAPDTLTGDGIYAHQGGMTIAIPIATNGNHTVVIFSGDYIGTGHNEITHLAKEVYIDAEGSEEWTYQRDPFFAQDYPYDPDADHWDRTAGTNRFIIAQFDVNVADGTLNLEVGTTSTKTDYAFPVNAIIVWPATDTAGLAAILEDIEEDRREQWALYYPRRESTLWTGPVWSLKPPAIGEYDVWWSEYLLRDYPTTLPVEKTRSTYTFATPGEWESLTFCIRSPFDLGAVTVTASDMTDGNGNTIDSDVIDVYYTELNNIVSPAGLWSEGNPFALMPNTGLTIQSNITRQFWLDIEVPTNVVAGKYTGIVTVDPATAGASTYTLAYEFEALPFSLVRSTNASFFHFGHYPKVNHDLYNTGNYNTYAQYWLDTVTQANQLTNHGFVPYPVVIISGSGAYEVDGTPTVDANTNLVSIDWGKGNQRLGQYKTNGWLPKDGFISVQSIGYGTTYAGQTHTPAPTWPADVRYSNLFVAISLKVDEWVTTNLNCEAVFEWHGEYGNYDATSVAAAVNAYSALRNAGLATALRGNSLNDWQLVKTNQLIDFFIPNIAMMRDEYSDWVVENTPAIMRGLWLYNYSADRYGFGLFAWEKGATRRLHEGYMNDSGAAWDKFDGDHYEWQIGAEPTRDGIATRIPMKWMREGRDDYDYMMTFQYWLTQVSTSHPAYIAATNDLAWIRSQLFTDIVYSGDPAEPGNTEDAFPVLDLQAIRIVMVNNILALMEATQHPYQEDLLFHVSFDAGTTTADYSLGVPTAVASSGTAVAAGHDGNGMDMVAGYIRYDTESNIVATAGTVAFWVKPHWAAPGSTTTRYFFAWNNPSGSATTNSVTFQYNSATDLRVLYAPQVSGSIERVDYIPTWTANTWHHLAFSWQPPRLRIYLDAVLVGEDEIWTTLNDPWDEWVIGAYSSGTQGANAVFDELYVYNREMSAQELSHISGIAPTASIVTAEPRQNLYHNYIRYVPYTVDLYGTLTKDHSLRLTVGDFLPVSATLSTQPVFQLYEPIPPGEYEAVLSLMNGDTVIESTTNTFRCIGRPFVGIQRSQPLDQARSSAISETIRGVEANVGSIIRAQ